MSLIGKARVFRKRNFLRIKQLRSAPKVIRRPFRIPKSDPKNGFGELWDHLEVTLGSLWAHGGVTLVYEVGFGTYMVANRQDIGRIRMISAGYKQNLAKHEETYTLSL